MTALADLRRQADDAAERRGHRLYWGRIHPRDRWERRERDARRTQSASCSCGAWVAIDTRPPANGIDVGGPAVAVNHGERLPGEAMPRTAWDRII